MFAIEIEVEDPERNGVFDLLRQAASPKMKKEIIKRARKGERKIVRDVARQIRNKLPKAGEKTIYDYGWNKGKHTGSMRKALTYKRHAKAKRFSLWLIGMRADYSVMVLKARRSAVNHTPANIYHLVELGFRHNKGGRVKGEGYMSRVMSQVGTTVEEKWIAAWHEAIVSTFKDWETNPPSV